MKNINVKREDVQPGDWADHTSRHFDPRVVESVDLIKWTVKLILSGDCITGDVPMDNYTFTREVP